MGKVQKSAALVLMLVSVLYFALFAFPNSTGARDTSMISIFEPDEFAQYPYLTKMLAFEKGDIKHDLYHFVVYGHYYYGYPFYFGSGLTLLPAKLLSGLNNKNSQIPLLLLRQVISVLPMLLAILVMTYTQTRFRSIIASVFTVALLLAIPAVVQNNFWWHPDSLVTLFVVLTLYFLDRDELRFGRNFVFAAVACGLATGTKVLGLFFCVAIPVYVVLGMARGRLSLARAGLRAIQFVAVMVASIVASNPFLLIPSEFGEMLRIQSGQASAMSAGWVLYYAKGPASWIPTITKSYSGPVFLILVGLILLVGICRRGPRQVLYIMILAWVVPFSLYILFFVAIKPSHFFLPIMVPLASCLPAALSMRPGNQESREASGGWPRPWVRSALLAVVVSIGLYQVAWSLTVDVPLYKTVLAREATNSAVAHYESLISKFLNVIPDNEPLLIYRDVRMYFPQSRNRRVLSFFNTTNYQHVQNMNPDLIVLWRQRILDYTNQSAAQNAIAPDEFKEVNRFFGDARAGHLAGYHLLFEDDAGLTFVRSDLYQRYFVP